MPCANRPEKKSDWRARELTPQRAFRKMKEKLKRDMKKEIKGTQHQPLIVRLASVQSTSNVAVSNASAKAGGPVSLHLLLGGYMGQ